MGELKVTSTASWQNHMNDWLAAMIYSEWECFFITSSFLAGSVLGCCSQLFVLTVVIYKVNKQQNKSAADQLMIVLTLTDLLGCGFLFPMEIKHFGFGHCNDLETDFAYGTTIFLETLSTLLLQSIAFNRALLVFWPNSNILTFTKSLILCLLDVILAVVIVVLVMKLQSHVIVFHIYTIFVFGNLALMALIYGLIFCKLCYRVHLAKRKKRQEHLRIANWTTSSAQADIESVAITQEASSQVSISPTTCPMERVRNRAALISVIITLVYAVCFIPNGILTLLVTVNPEFLFVKSTNVSVAAAKYLQFFYNLNFVLMPLVYAVLSQQFRQDWAEFFVSLKRTNIGRWFQNTAIRSTDHLDRNIVETGGSQNIYTKARAIDEPINAQTNVRVSCRNNQSETIVQVTCIVGQSTLNCV